MASLFNMANTVMWLALVFFFLIRLSNCNLVIVGKGHPASLQCAFPDTVTNVTWQLLDGSVQINISACSVVNDTCSNFMPDLYQASISTSGNVTLVGLNITRAQKMATHFACLSDNGVQVNANLEVYAWPKVPTCYQIQNATYVELRCHTSNVYPDAVAVPHRRETDFTNQDFDLPHSECSHGHDGAGTDGDYVVECRWLIPVQSMLVNNTIYVAMTPAVSNLSTIDTAPSVSTNIIIKFHVPEVRITSTLCPHGDYVHGDSIPIGKTGTCPCVLQVEGEPAGRAGWFTQDGRAVEVDDTLGKNSTLTVSYNYSDPYQTYECRPVTPLRANGTSFYYTPKFVENYTSVLIGQASHLECSFADTVTNITWQMVSQHSTINVSTCSPGKSCNDHMSTNYRGVVISGSGGRATFRLNVSSARINESQFLCLADDGLKSNITQLDVYAMPNRLVCNQVVNENNVKYACTAYRVYPALSAVLHLTGAHSEAYEIQNYTAPYTSDQEGCYSVNFYWIVYIKPDMHQMNVYVEVRVNVYNQPITNNTSVFSGNMSVQFSVPEVVLNKTYCPFGPGVKGDKIEIGSEASCKCDVKTRGVPPGHARWLKNRTVWLGKDNELDGSSTLNITYFPTSPNDTYECVPITVLRWGEASKVFYTPTFVPKQSAATHGLQPMVIILAVVCSGVAARVF